MTTVRDVIARSIFNALVTDERCKDTIARQIVEALLSAPDLEPHPELAARLNPWRPIETAPKPVDDEAWLLGCDEDGNCAVITWTGNYWIDNYGGSIEPAYFQFLPAPPPEGK